MSTPITQLAAMCQRASDEAAGAQRVSAQTKDGCEKLWLDAAAMERFDQEQRLREALLCTPPTTLADALILAVNLSSHVLDDEEGETVTFTSTEWRSIHVALESLVLALAREAGTGDLTKIDASTVNLWQNRANRRAQSAAADEIAL